ncbi:MAG TPA: hypothetical protein DCQ94_02690 [Nitrospira sp.]|nr:hypothetical protein [Nitrospira sp.]HRK48703.1 hypothetical protein [Nocardioides sp.]
MSDPSTLASLSPRRSPLWLSLVAASSLIVGCVDEELDALGDDPTDDPTDPLSDDGDITTESDGEPETWAVGSVAVIATTGGTDQGGTPTIRVPNGTRAGDLLLLFLHRTDDTNFWANNGSGDRLSDRLRPWRSGGWKGPVATCAFDNSAGDFDCAGQQNDLNQVLYWKKATTDDLRPDPRDSTRYEPLTIDFPGSRPAWAIMATVRNGGASSNPVRAWAGQTRCDNVEGTRFPAVSGAKAGDLLLLSQSFDDGTGSPGYLSSSSFTARSPITRYRQVLDRDEAGHLYGRVLTADGTTPVYETNGDPDRNLSHCKDIAVSIVIRRSGT